MLKLTIPDVPDFYAPLISTSAWLRVVALSGGYTRADACQRLAANHGMIASFSRALVGPAAFDERRRVRRGAGDSDRRDLPGLDREGLRLDRGAKRGR